MHVLVIYLYIIIILKLFLNFHTHVKKLNGQYDTTNLFISCYTEVNVLFTLIKYLIRHRLLRY